MYSLPNGGLQPISQIDFLINTSQGKLDFLKILGSFRKSFKVRNSR